VARAAVLELLRGDSQLVALGTDWGIPLVIVPNFEADQKPSEGMFIVICWRHTDFEEDIQDNAGRHLEIYFHVPALKSTDFGRIDAMNDRVDAIFRAVEDAPVTGGDGQRLIFVMFEGRGPDLTDPDYQTICRQAAYMALGDTVSA
jgi:hypothetical protein